MIISVMIGVANLLELAKKPIDWVAGLFFALLNGVVMCAAVLGINDTVVKKGKSAENPPAQQQMAPPTNPPAGKS